MESEAPEDRPVAVMDSGVGGLPYLEAVRALMPERSFVYLADRAGFPYGRKTREVVEGIVRDRVSRLVAAHHPAAVVIACNTASQAALAAVRRDHPELPVIGTVPAIKPASERTRKGIIGVLATDGTIRDPYLDELISQFASGVRVVRRGAQELVEFVERDYLGSDPARRREAVAAHVHFLVGEGVDEIVLACTHFLHVADDIAACAAELAGPGAPAIEVVDSREGVAKRVRDLLGGGASGSREGSLFLLTGPRPFEEVYSGFAARYGLGGPEALDGKDA